MSMTLFCSPRIEFVRLFGFLSISSTAGSVLEESQAETEVGMIPAELSRMLLETDTLGRVKPIVSFAALPLLILDTHPVKGGPR